MAFDHYDNAELGADLVNTVGSNSGHEYLPDVASLTAFLAEHGRADLGTPQEGDLVYLRRLRNQLTPVFLSDEEEDKVARLNELLGGVGLAPRLVMTGGRWELAHVSEEDTLGRRIAAEIVSGLARVTAEIGPARFGYCGADDCKDAFVDTSRNRSRRYCADTCSTRMNVAAYRARKRAAT